MEKHHHENVYEEELNYVQEVNRTRARKILPLKKMLNRYVIAAFIVTLLLLCGIWRIVSAQTTWRAVFLTNNQVYFGHFVEMPFSGTITLRSIYYIQLAGPLQPQSEGTQQPGIQIIKLGNEIHGPQDKMVIPKRNVMFWEDLRSDSPVVRAIKEYAKNK